MKDEVKTEISPR